jgi:hypothetical protein
MRNVEILLVVLSFLMFILKKITIPLAAIGFSFFMSLLALFYLTSKLHIFRNKDFPVSTTLISGCILSFSIISVLLYLNNWNELMKPLLTILSVQILWFTYLILKKKKTLAFNKLSTRIGIIAVIFLFVVLYDYLIASLQIGSY